MNFILSFGSLSTLSLIAFFIRQGCKYWRGVQKTLQKRTEYISLYYREIERGKGNKREMCACIHQGYWPTCMCLRYDFIYSRGQLEPEHNNKQQYHNTFISATPDPDAIMVQFFAWLRMHTYSHIYDKSVVRPWRLYFTVTFTFHPSPFTLR